MSDEEMRSIAGQCELEDQQAREWQQSQSELAPVTLLGELWTRDELCDARHVLSCVYEGVDCSLPMDRLRELEKRGLVTDINLKPGRGRYANRYEYMWTDKLEELVKAYRTSSPNKDSATPKP